MSTPFSAETVELLASRQVTWSISPFRREELEWFRQRLQTQNDEWARANRSTAEAKPLNEQALLRAGVPVTLNTGGSLLSADSLRRVLLSDRTPPGVDRITLGKSHFNTLLGAQDIGMKPMDILRAATRNIAKAYKVDEDLGTLERGKFADLLVLDHDPLENAANYGSISVVIKEGEVIDRDALPTQRLLTVP
jgi:imidazolonepropionase-like amidohydrolase